MFHGERVRSAVVSYFFNHSPTYVFSKCKFFADDLKIYLKIRPSNIVDMSSDLCCCQIDIDAKVHVASSLDCKSMLQKCCVM